jgi:hypothetical protein
VRYVARNGTEDAQHQGFEEELPRGHAPLEHIPGAPEPPEGLGKQGSKRRAGAPARLTYEPEGGSAHHGWESTRPPPASGDYEEHEFGSLGGGYGEQGFGIAGPHRRIRTPLATGPFTGIGPRGYRRTDERIREDVCDALTEHGHIDPRSVTLEVIRGDVHLAGEVSSAAMRGLIEDVAGSVPGVRGIHNALAVRRAPSALREPGRVGLRSAPIPRPRSGRGTS